MKPGNKRKLAKEIIYLFIAIILSGISTIVFFQLGSKNDFNISKFNSLETHLKNRSDSMIDILPLQTRYYYVISREKPFEIEKGCRYWFDDYNDNYGIEKPKKEIEFLEYKQRYLMISMMNSDLYSSSLKTFKKHYTTIDNINQLYDKTIEAKMFCGNRIDFLKMFFPQNYENVLINNPLNKSDTVNLSLIKSIQKELKVCRQTLNVINYKSVILESQMIFSYFVIFIVLFVIRYIFYVLKWSIMILKSKDI